MIGKIVSYAVVFMAGCFVGILIMCFMRAASDADADYWPHE